ncbi:EcsC family protein [Archangium violaceum]|uniref:EcsC family protein n=1 Tax=Archangium violaceum TaxID=83451 RepID=UPI0036D91E66
MAAEETSDDSKLLRFIQRWAISPEEAKEIARKYRTQSESKYSKDSASRHQARVADKIIARYAKLSAMSGGATALVGIVPGLGTALAALGGGLADTAVSMKLQVDMVCCLAESFGYDLNAQDARDLAFLIAAGGAIEKAGEQLGVKLASKAGVRLLREYLKGAALQAVKVFFKRVGIIFTRKALEKALPFGVGVVIGGTANYALTRYVGAQAKEWFILDQEMPEPGPREDQAAA